MKPLIHGTFLALLAVGTMFAAVKTDYDHSIPFEKYHTFAWAARPAPSAPGDNTLLRNRITKAVDQQLGAKGMSEDAGNPDVYLRYRFVSLPRRDVTYFPGWGWRRGGWAGPNVFVSRYSEGTFMIDMVDAKTNQLVWRAYGSDTGSNPLDVQSEKNVDKIVSQALKHFPPKDAHKG